jgi:hypothetical protein
MDCLPDFSPTNYSPIMKLSRPQDRLFIGYYPTGIVYADIGREEHGDYKRVAFLSYKTLIFEPAIGANKLLIEEAKSHAALIQARKGEPMTVTSSGQTVLLGF